MSASALPVPLFALSTFMEYVLLGAALLIVAGGVMFWAVAIRKPPGKPRYKYHRAAPDQPPPSKRKRKRRSEPPLNPTLAETRGLPPVRESNSGAKQDYRY
ncbi:MAG: hypothetical protein QM813_17710 [Verrucomicrobiota bacterium]